MLGHNGGGLVASGEDSRGGGRHMVDGVGHHSAGGVVVGTSGRVGGGSHDVGGDPVAGGGGHLGAGVCQLGPDAGAGQDEGKCGKRLHSRHKSPSVLDEGLLKTGGSGHITIARGHSLSPQVTLCTLRGPPGNGRERPSGGRGNTATCLVTATADSTFNFCVSIRPWPQNVVFLSDL